MKIEREAFMLAAAYIVVASIWFFLPNQFLLWLLAGRSPGESRIYLDYILLVAIAGLLVTSYVVQQRRLNKEKLNHRTAEAAFQLQQAYVSTLAQTSAAMNSRRDLISVLELICKEIASILGVQASTILVYSDERGQIDLAAMYGLPIEFQKVFAPVQITSHALKLAQQEHPAVIRTNDPGFADFAGAALYQKYGVTSMAFMPLSNPGEFLGILAAMTIDGPIQFSASQLALLKTFSDHASIALRHARMFAGVREGNRKLEALRTGDLAILSSLDLNLTLKIFLQSVVTELQADATDVLFFNPGSQSLEYADSLGFTTGKIKESKVAIGDGIAGKIALERRTMYLTDIENVNQFNRHEMIEHENFSTYFGIPLIAKGELKGILEVYHRKPFRPTDPWLSFLETLAGQAAIAIDNASMFSNLRRTHSDLMLAYDRTLAGWSHAMELKDRETQGHNERVTELCMELAQAMNIPEEEMIHMRRGAILHDVGKMGIPDEILRKPGSLSPGEEKIMQMHPIFAMEMLSPIKYLVPALEIPYCHHERWDGSGYPRGIKGEVIPLSARIFSVVDVWDELITDRPYRKAIPREEALQYICEKAGVYYDTNVVEAFVKLQA